MNRTVIVGIVSASLLLSGSTVFAHPFKSNKFHFTNEESVMFIQKAGLENAFEHVKNKHARETIFRNIEKHHGKVNKENNENNEDDQNDDQDENKVTTADQIVVTPSVTTGDQIVVTSPVTTGDTVTINPTINVTNEIIIKFNGKVLSFDQKPVVVNGRTLVPLREIFESLGAKINWDGKTGTVKAGKGKQNVMLTVGSNTATVNGKTIKLEQKSEIINKKTMIPLRFISESFGTNVTWDPSTRTIALTQK